jgi:asparagine synthase (glutamine-hydrolysing)
MFRFIAWCSNQRSASNVRLSNRLRTSLRSISGAWRIVLNTPNLEVWCSGEQSPAMIARTLPEDAGVVLGSLFHRASDLGEAVPSITSIDSSLARQISSSKGEALVGECWGSYVAFIRHGSDRILTLVAPTGNLPCLFTRIEGLTLWCSNVLDLYELNVIPFEISQAYLSDRVIGRFEAQQPSILGIERLQRGECQIIDVRCIRSVQRHLYWQPLYFAEQAEPIEDPVRAANALRDTIRHCIHTLALAHEPLLLRLSGGLDSSIIAGCLRDVRHPERITCHTYFNPRSAADVRPWARMAAQHSRLRHVECPSDPDVMDLRALTDLAASYDVQPLLSYLGRSALERTLCSEYGATAVFTGDGGDPGFCSDTIAYALVEYFQRHGLHPVALDLARQVSLATDRSIWQVLTRSFQRWRRGSSLADQQNSRKLVSRLVSRDIAQAAEHDTRYNHPWFAHRENVPWPTIRRLGALCHPPSFYDLSVEKSEFAPLVVHPLYAQPVVETMLRIPLYVHFENGRDRGLARRAFAAELPEPIAERLWKDRAPGFLEHLIDRHRAWLRELFLDGVLVTSRLLDRGAVERALSTSPSREYVNPAEIFRHLDIEIWARHWSSRRREVSSQTSLSSIATTSI